MGEELGWGQKLKGMLSNDALPVALGMGAQAAMEEHQTSWPAMLGRSVVDLQRSNIAAKAAKRQGTERDSLKMMLGRLLSGQGLSGAELDGPTTANLTINPGGDQTFKVTGNKMFGGGTQFEKDAAAGNVSAGGGSALKGAIKGPQSSASPPQVGSGGGPPGVTAPQGQSTLDPRLLPLFLAQATGSSGGSGQSLAGLTPEQIHNISGTDIAGGALSQKGVGDIFTNMQKQAYTDYLGRLPQQGSGSRPTMQMKPGADGYWHTFNNAGQETRTNTKVPPDYDSSANYQMGEIVGRDGVRRQVVFKNGVPMNQNLGVTPESTIEDTRSHDISMDLADIEARIRSDDYVQSDLDNFNRRSEGEFYYTPGTGFFGGREANKLPLPAGVSARDAHATLNKYKQKYPEMTIEKLIELYKKNKQ